MSINVKFMVNNRIPIKVEELPEHIIDVTYRASYFDIINILAFIAMNGQEIIYDGASYKLTHRILRVGFQNPDGENYFALFKYKRM